MDGLPPPSPGKPTSNGVKYEAILDFEAEMKKSQVLLLNHVQIKP